MGFRVRLGPVSVGNKSAGVNVGPFSASTAYKSKGGNSSENSPSAIEMITMVLIVAVWQFTLPHFLNKQLTAEGYQPSKAMSVISKVLVPTIFLAIYFGFAGYEKAPAFYIGISAAALINCFFAIPGFIIYAVAYEIIKSKQTPVLPTEPSSEPKEG